MQATTPVVRPCYSQEPQVLFTLLPSNNVDVDHDNIEWKESSVSSRKTDIYTDVPPWFR